MMNNKTFWYCSIVLLPHQTVYVVAFPVNKHGWVFSVHVHLVSVIEQHGRLLDVVDFFDGVRLVALAFAVVQKVFQLAVNFFVDVQT